MDETRLEAIERRLARLERLLRVEEPPVAEPAPPAAQPPVPSMHPPAAPPPSPRETVPAQEISLEELFGGRVLAWLGGSAVVLGAVFFLVMAVSRGWIDEPTRVVLAFLGSTVLLGVALWLHERKGQTQASLALAAASIASLYASLVVGTVVYELIPDAAGLAIAGLVGAVAAAIAVRWSSQVVGGIGILGALLAPVLVGAGTSSASLAFMAVALVAAVAVLVWQRWPWLAFGSFVVGVPQLLDWIDDERDRLVLALAVLALFWALYVVAALAHEVRVPTPKLRVSSAMLLFADVLLVAGAGWGLLHDRGRNAEATAWVLGVAAAHLAIGLATLRGRISRQIGALLVALGTAVSAIGFALALSGPALVVGWAVHAVLLAWLAGRTEDERATIGAIGFLMLALGHVLLFEAPPDALANGLDDAAKGVIGVAVVAAAAAVSSRVAVGRLAPWREILESAAGALLVYLGSVAIVDASGATAASGTTQGGQLALSAFWSATGVAAVVAGLVTDRRRLRLGGLGLLAIAIVKVFLVDLATLESIYRVGSFVGLGLLLIGCAFAYQRVRREVRP
jgi:uncharacterized membrane protein